MAGPDSGDAIVLVPNKNMDDGLRGLLTRPKALGIREIEARIFVHPRRDPACVRESDTFLRPFAGRYSRALVMFDRRGSGREELSTDVLAAEVRGRLALGGWGDRVEVIVLDPELEIWVFASSPQVDRCLGWTASDRSLRQWLEGQKLWDPGRPKPSRPREALDRVLREVQLPRSSALYGNLGRRVSVKACSDPAFFKLRETLARWFPPEVTV